MKRSYLLAEVLLALILLAMLAPPLVTALKGRHKKAVVLSKKVEALRCFDATRLAILQNIKSSDLDELEKSGSIEFLDAKLTLKKEGVRSNLDKRTYWVRFDAHGMSGFLCLSCKKSLSIEKNP